MEENVIILTNSKDNLVCKKETSQLTSRSVQKTRNVYFFRFKVKDLNDLFNTRYVK